MPAVPRAPRWLSLGLTVFLGSLPIAAQELVTDRPDQTESAEVVAPSRFQLETGAVWEVDDDDGVDVDTLTVPSSLLRIGLVERAELRVGWTGFVFEDVELGGVEVSSEGAGDAELGFKVKLAGGRGSRPAIALLAGTSLDVGATDLSSGRADPSARLSLAWDPSERLSLGTNAGVEMETTGSADERDTGYAFVYTTALGIGLGERAGAFVEVFGTIPGSAPGGPAHAFDGGFTWLARPNLQLDVAAGVGLNDAAPDAFAGVGVSVRLPR